jgi:hypothetical protein
MPYTQASEGAHRWETATYTVKGSVFTFTVTGYGGEAPTGSPGPAWPSRTAGAWITTG